MLPVGHPFVLVQDALHPVQTRNGPRQLSEKPAEHPHRQCHQPEEVCKCDESARRQESLVHPPQPHCEDGEDADVGQSLDERVEGGAQTPHLDHPVSQRIGRLTEPADLGILTAQRLDDQSGVE